MARNRRQQIAFETLEERFWALVDRSDVGGCWPWTGRIDGAGYGRFRGAKEPTVSQLAHRTAWQFANKAQIESGMHVLHGCDFPRCCNPAHLTIGTHQDNMRDRDTKGRQRAPHGERCGKAKLTLLQVVEIRERVAAGEVQATIARSFGISPSAVHLIKKGRNWAHDNG